jgi:nucleotide-binding universal stress UspA family protein
VSYLEGEDPARTIAAAATDAGSDVIVLGATRPIFDESSWESVSMRVIEEGSLPVVIVPAMPRDADEEAS